MPVTVRPSAQLLEEYGGDRTIPLNTSQDVLSHVLRSGGNVDCKEIFQSAFSVDFVDQERVSTNLSQGNVRSPFLDHAFVGAAMEAYNHHHHLVIRPDDVWISILMQFNSFVNANAEELRSQFVAHKGRKSLVVEAEGCRYTFDFGNMAAQMSRLMEENIVDPDLRSWIMPRFTTSTDVDNVVYSVTMMSTLKQYFEYHFCSTCNLPAVTLLGEKRDWESLLSRIDKLLDYGEQTTRWHSLLKPVLKRFVQTFEDPTAKSTAEFWNRIAHYHSGGSGSDYISGWISAFCAFNKEGKPLYDRYAGFPEAVILDGVKYHPVDKEDIPTSYCSVDVKLVDGDGSIDTAMVAGALACKIGDSQQFSPDLDGQFDSIQPVAGWIMYHKGNGKKDKLLPK